jgi:hypothetical protein
VTIQAIISTLGKGPYVQEQLNIRYIAYANYDRCVRIGNLKLLIYLHEKWVLDRWLPYELSDERTDIYPLAPWTLWTCCAAAVEGHVDCLKYAHQNGAPLTENTCLGAAIRGHLDCLKYAHENGVLITQRDCDIAASNGHLDCLKYAHEHGGHLSTQICDTVASNGHLDCLKYAHEHGCDLTENTIVCAISNVDCLDYVREKYIRS